MNRYPVDAAAFDGVMAAEATARPVREYLDGKDTGEQAKNADGVPMWRIGLLIRTDTGVETVPVKFPSKTEPKFSVMGEVRVSGLSVFASSDGKTYLSASELTAVGGKAQAQSA